MARPLGSTGSGLAPNPPSTASSAAISRLMRDTDSCNFLAIAFIVMPHSRYAMRCDAQRLGPIRCSPQAILQRAGRLALRQTLGLVPRNSMCSRRIAAGALIRCTLVATLGLLVVGRARVPASVTAEAGSGRAASTLAMPPVPPLVRPRWQQRSRRSRRPSSTSSGRGSPRRRHAIHCRS